MLYIVLFALLILFFFIRPPIQQEPLTHRGAGNVKPSRLIEVLLWLILSGSIVSALVDVNSWVRWMNYFCIHFSAVFLILIALRVFNNRLKQMAEINKTYLLLVPMFIICCLSTALGIALRGNIISLVIDSLLPQAGAFLILLTAYRPVCEKLVSVLRLHMLCIIIFTIYCIYISPVSLASMERDKLLLSPEATAYTMLPLVLFFVGIIVGKTDWKSLLATLVGYTTYFYAILRYKSRTAIGIIMVIVPLCFISMQFKHKGITRTLFSFFKLVIVVSVILGIILFIQPDWSPKLNRSLVYAQIMTRFAGNVNLNRFSDVKSGLMKRLTREVTISRGGEARDFLKSLNVLEYVTGKGFGLMWYSEYWGMNWNIVHIGPLHLIFKGGLPLLFIYSMILLAAVKASWRNSRKDPIAMGCFIYLIAWIVMFLFYGAYPSCYAIYVFWLIVGMAISSDNDRKMYLRINRK